MTISELYAKLCDPKFQNPRMGDLFYNFFIYQYPSSEEYAIREKIIEFKENLVRPVNNIDVLPLNLFEEFCEFLDSKPFGKRYPSYLKYVLEKEGEHSEEFVNILSQKARSEEFLRFIHRRILEHISIKDELHRPYVFVYGVGLMFPYLRASEFLSQYEVYNKSSEYKVILFYPGRMEGTDFRLFETLNDHHTYRAILLIND